MELIPGRKKQRTCIIATTTLESFETHGFDMRNHKSQHRRHGRRVKITSGQTRLFIRVGTPLIHMELQDPDLHPNSMQDDTPTPPTLSRTTTTKRPVLSLPVPTTLFSTSRTRKQKHGRLLEQQQKWNQDHATAIQELRQDTTTMNDNITTMMQFWNIG